MRAFIVDRYGNGGGNLRSGDVPEPGVGQHEITGPVTGRVFLFESPSEAMAYVEAGRAKGKVVVTVR
jgi:NADPH:quinone reductase-like Zn-dependent oxidoreductase